MDAPLVGYFSPLDRRVHNPPLRYTLLKPLLYIRPSGEEILIPAGFHYDGDSVPRIPVAYWLLKGRAQKAATVHDWLYARQAGKAYADEVFLEAMAVEGLGWFTRRSIYAGVWAFGQRAYASHRGGKWAAYQPVA